MYASWLLLLCSLAVVFLTLKQAHLPNYKTPIALFMASACFFSLRDSETFLFGSLFCSTITFFLAIVSFHFISILRNEVDRKNLLLAISASFLTTFAGFAGGVFCWPIGLAAIIAKACLQKQNQSVVSSLKKWKTPILLWLCASAASACLYYMPPAQTAVSSDLLHKVAFFFTLLGFPIFSSDFQVYGVIHLTLITFAIGLFFCNFQNTQAKLETDINVESIPLILGFSLCAFAFAISVVITMGRCEISDPSCVIATAPRYALWTNLSLLGGYFITVGDRSSKRLLKNCVLVASFVCIILGYFCGLERSSLQGKFTTVQLSQIRYFLLSYKQQPEETLLKLYPDLPNLLATAKNIEKRGWSVFAQRLEELDKLPSCSTQMFQVKLVSPYQKEGEILFIDRAVSPMFAVTGWSIDKETNRPSSDICLNIGNDFVMQGVCGQPSDELAAFFPQKRLLNSGFLITFATKHLRPGIYPVCLTIANNARTHAMKSPVIFTLKVK